jgi:UDP-N-acetylmuramate dehydrogenase
MKTLPFEFAISDYPLAPATLYNVGGPARLALLPRNPEEVVVAHNWMLKQEGPRLILGGGSNVLIADAGFPGIVLFTTELKRLEDLGGDSFYAASGIDLDDLVQQVMLPNNYGGVGALAGIPGSVGGALYMNAGTVNGSTCQFVESVDVVNANGLQTIAVDSASHGYRKQTFCATGDVIIGGRFSFSRAEEDQRSIYEHYIQRRLMKQPQGYCCGSVFRNPEGDHAGRLIEACGLKGRRMGGAVISDVHANFIMNEEGASFDDIRGLIELAKGEVRARFGIELQEEVRVISA